MTIRSTSTCNLGRRGNRPFHFRGRRRVRQRPLPILQIRPSSRTTRSRSGLCRTFLGCRQQVSRCTPLEGREDLNKYRVLATSACLRTLKVSHLRALHQVHSRSCHRHECRHSREGVHPIPTRRRWGSSSRPLVFRGNTYVRLRLGRPFMCCYLGLFLS